MDEKWLEALEYPLQPEVLISRKRALKRVLLGRSGLVDKKIAILGGSSTSEVRDYLELFLLNGGIRPDFYETNYGQYYDEILFDPAKLVAHKPEFVYIHTTFRNVTGFPALHAGQSEMEAALAAELDRFQKIWQRAHDLLGGTILQNNFELPDVRGLGNLDTVAYGGRTQFLHRLNQKFHDYARENRHLVVNDIHYLSSWLGLSNWHDRTLWHAYKYAMSLDAMVHVAFSVSHLIQAVLGRTRKCLVLDLDNTLWGGAIGEVGPDGIQLGPDSPEGEGYRELQRYAKGLADRGVLLAVASKNAEENAKQGFSHPDTVLRLDDFSAFQASWDDKANSLGRIAQELNIGLESLVFIDDNPAERKRVHDSLPAVAVPDVGRRAENFIDAVDKAGYFETIGLSQEDRERSQYYVGDKQRKALQGQLVDYDTYLDSLRMKAEILPFSTAYLDRIHQLINKTNQFNLTTKRLSGAEVQRISAGTDYLTLYVRLTDAVGESGLISAVIGRVEGPVLHLEVWVMSCRVLKRGVEFALFDTLVRECGKRGIKELRGYYIPSAKNALVKDLYTELGFSVVASTAPGGSVFGYVVPDKFTPRNRHIVVNDGTL